MKIRSESEVKVKRQNGFSLLEMMFVVAILTIVMGVVFRQIGEVQKRSRTEEVKLDLTQESREFMDQVVRDMHSIGYPTAKMYNTGTITVSPVVSSKQVAAGLVKVAYDELWFEGDVDGDGIVDVIDYKLQTVNGNCPCKISRSQVQKQDLTLPLSQNSSNYSMELTDVINSGGAGGGSTGTAKYTISGGALTSSGTANNTTFATYKNANVFTYYDVNGNQVTPIPSDISTTAGQATISTIKTIRININVLGHQADLQTLARPVMSYSAAVRLPNQ